jgi:hypothetical protein
VPPPPGRTPSITSGSPMPVFIPSTAILWHDKFSVKVLKAKLKKDSEPIKAGQITNTYKMRKRKSPDDKHFSCTDFS